VPPRRARDVLRRLGFERKGRHFAHPETEFFVEFPSGPLTVGEQRVNHVGDAAQQVEAVAGDDAAGIGTDSPSSRQPNAASAASARWTESAALR